MPSNSNRMNKIDEELKKEIYRIYKESDGRFGSKKILIKLKDIGINTTINKVKTLMKFLNISSTQKLRKCEPKIEKKGKDNSQYYINKLKKKFY